MIKKSFLKLFIILLCSLITYSVCLISSMAQESTPAQSATQQFLNSLFADHPAFPRATVHCRTKGSLRSIIPDGRNRVLAFSSEGNGFFYENDTVNKRMAVLENGSANNNRTQYDANIFIRADGVTKQNLQDLIINMSVVVTNQAKVVFAVDVTPQGGQAKTYLYASNGDIGTPGDCTLQTKFDNLGNITSMGTKYIVANGTIRIIFNRPITILNPAPLEQQPVGGGEVICSYSNLPLDDDYLPGVESAFDGTLVNDIKTAAGL